MFQPHRVYRLHYTMDDHKLRGRAVVFYEQRLFTKGDVVRCRVRLLLPDGSSGPEYLVKPSCLIKL